MGKLILIGLCFVACVGLSIVFVVVGSALAVDLVRHPPQLVQREVVYVVVPVNLSPTMMPLPTPTLVPVPVMQINVPALVQPATLTVPASAQCDASYPDFCIAPSSADTLNCDDIAWRGFRVIGIDIHGFDRERDGVGCES